MPKEKSYRFWTEEEENYLREHYYEEKKKNIADKLNRTESAVKHKARKLGLTNPECGKWTKEEVSFLKENCYDMKLKEIAKALGKSRKGVYNKRYQLGLTPRTYRKVKDLKSIQLSEENAAYLAGLIDGEGSITFRGDPSPGSSYSMHIYVTNTDRDILGWIKKETGVGRIYVHSHSSSNTCYRWGIHSIAEIKPFLEEIHPYLKVKTEVSELMLRLCNSRLDKGYGSPWDDTEQELAQEIKEKNKR